MPEKPSVTLPGTVNRVIPSLSPHNAGTVEISVHTAHDLHQEVRIENTLTNESGGKVSLKLGSPVEVTITAEAGSTPSSLAHLLRTKRRPPQWAEANRPPGNFHCAGCLKISVHPSGARIFSSASFFVSFA